MKKERLIKASPLLLILLIIFMCLGCNSSTSTSSGNTFQFTEQDTGKEVTVTLKDSIKITISNTWTESWILDTTVNEYFKIETLPAIAIYPSINAWQLKPIKIGATKIKAHTQTNGQIISDTTRYFELKVQIIE